MSRTKFDVAMCGNLPFFIISNKQQKKKPKYNNSSLNIFM